MRNKALSYLRVLLAVLALSTFTGCFKSLEQEPITGTEAPEEVASTPEDLGEELKIIEDLIIVSERLTSEDFNSIPNNLQTPNGEPYSRKEILDDMGLSGIHIDSVIIYSHIYRQHRDP